MHESELHRERNGKFEVVLHLLLGALRASQVFGEQHEAYAPTWSELSDRGVAEDEMQTLIGRGLVRPIRDDSDPTRAAGQPADPAWPDSARFTLTPWGLSSVLHLKSESDAGLAAPAPSPDRPRWVSDRRELRYQGRVVKTYHHTAPNQQCVLDAFEAADWCLWIRSPLTPDRFQDPVELLRDTIKNLNRGHQSSLLRFVLDNRSGRIGWTPLPDPVRPPRAGGKRTGGRRVCAAGRSGKPNPPPEDGPEARSRDTREPW